MTWFVPARAGSAKSQQNRQAYHWMLERGRFRLLGLVAALCGIVRRETCGPRRFAIIDDTLAPRCSAKAPDAAVRFDHARKTNRPTFLLCQAFVTLCAVVPCRDRPRSVPILTGLCRGVGHAGLSRDWGSCRDSC